MSQSFTVEVGGARLVGECAGSGTPIVFLHAGVADRRMFRAQLHRFGDRHLALAYDRRGFGETTTTDVPFSHVDDLLAVLEARNLGPAVLVGCSQGGRVAIDFALAHRDRVKALVLIAPAISGAPVLESVPEAIAALIQEADEAEEAEDIERLNRIEAHLWLDGPLSARGRVSGAARQLFLEMNEIALRAPEQHRRREPPPAMDRLGELDLPVLLLCGDLDFPSLQERQQRLLVVLPDSRARIVSGTAHLTSFEQPEVFNAELTAFLGEHRGSGPGAVRDGRDQNGLVSGEARG
jgi:pimeloyl-ACP methyl ester carboxylesterase